MGGERRKEDTGCVWGLGYRSARVELVVLVSAVPFERDNIIEG